MATKKAAQEVNFEKSLARLEEIVQALEQGDLALDKSLELFKEGVELSKFCSQKLTVAQKDVQKIVEDNKGNFTLETFTEEDN